MGLVMRRCLDACHHLRCWGFLTLFEESSSWQITTHSLTPHLVSLPITNTTSFSAGFHLRPPPFARNPPFNFTLTYIHYPSYQHHGSSWTRWKVRQAYERWRKALQSRPATARQGWQPDGHVAGASFLALQSSSYAQQTKNRKHRNPKRTMTPPQKKRPRQRKSPRKTTPPLHPPPAPK